MTFNITNIPKDVLQITWNYLDKDSLRSAAQVCRRFRTLTQTILAHTEVEAKFLKCFVAQSPTIHEDCTPSTIIDPWVTAVPSDVVSSQFFISRSRSRIDELILFNFTDNSTNIFSFEKKNISAFSICKSNLYVAFLDNTIVVKNLKTEQIQQFVADSETKILEIIGDGGKNVLLRNNQKISIFQIDAQNKWMDVTPEMSECRHINPAKDVISVYLQFKKNKLYFLNNKQLIIFDLKPFSERKICKLEDSISYPRYYYHRCFKILNGSLFYINGYRTHLVEYEISANKTRRFRIPNAPKNDRFVSDLSAFKCFLIYSCIITGGNRRSFECFDTKTRKWVKISINPDFQRPISGEFQFLKNGMVIEGRMNNTFLFFDYLRPVDKKLSLIPALKSLYSPAKIVVACCLGAYFFPKFKYHFFTISLASVCYTIYKNNVIRNLQIAFSKS